MYINREFDALSEPEQKKQNLNDIEFVKKQLDELYKLYEKNMNEIGSQKRFNEAILEIQYSISKLTTSINF